MRDFPKDGVAEEIYEVTDPNEYPTLKPTHLIQTHDERRNEWIPHKDDEEYVERCDEKIGCYFLLLIPKAVRSWFRSHKFFRYSKTKKHVDKTSWIILYRCPVRLETVPENYSSPQRPLVFCDEGTDFLGKLR